jgi:hypothetical protein
VLSEKRTPVFRKDHAPLNASSEKVATGFPERSRITNEHDPEKWTRVFRKIEPDAATILQVCGDGTRMTVGY